jgi:hypothetical protein
MSTADHGHFPHTSQTPGCSINFNLLFSEIIPYHMKRTMTHGPSTGPETISQRTGSLIVAVLLLLSFPLHAQTVLLGWEMNGLSAYGPSPFAPGTIDPDVLSGGLVRGTGIGTTGTAAANAWGGNDAATISLADAITAGDFFTFTITPDPGHRLSLSSIAAYNIRRSASGPTTGQWQYRVGNSGTFQALGSAITYGTVTTATGNPQAAITLSGISALQNIPADTTVTFRLVHWGGTAAGGTVYFNQFQTGDDLRLLGTVEECPTAEISYAGTPYCAGEGTAGVTFDGTGTGGTYSSTSGLAIDPVTGDINLNTSDPGTYTVTYTLPDGEGCPTATTTLVINALPEVSCPSNMSACADEGTFELGGGSPGGGTFSGPGVSGGMFEPAAAGEGLHEITYSYTGANGCTNECIFSITVYPTPVMSCPDDMMVCILDGTIVPGGSPPGGTHTGTGITNGAFDPQVAGAGAHVIVYTFTNDQGCTATCEFTITVDPDTDGDGICDADDACPLTPGQVNSFCDADPGSGFLLGRLDEDCVCQAIVCDIDVVLELQLDANPGQTTWEITADDSPLVICSGSGAGTPPGAVLPNECCLAEGCFRLRVYDDAGDGMTTGGYILRYPGMTTGAFDPPRIIDNRNNFTTGTVSGIDGNTSFCLPVGPNRPIFTSCDKLDWVDNQFIVASLDPDVNAEWLAGQPFSAQDANTGYEFWFFDPNGGYSFRIFKALNNASGYGTTFSRAAHLLLNSWAPANHIPHNSLMNVRIRAVVNGEAKDWGPACRFQIDPAAAACPTTKLMDIPGNRFISCGQWRRWATNQGVHARPVSGATQYQFRFYQPGETYDQTITTGNYFVRLGWAATTGEPLVPGQQYQVVVRAFRNGQWCPWGEACALNICPLDGPCPPETSGLMFSQEVATEITVNMWPNPNRGDQLNIQMDRLPAGMNSFSMDVFDLQGRRVLAREIPVSADAVITTVDLGGSLPHGIYLVNIAVGDQMNVQRLVIER